MSVLARIFGERKERERLRPLYDAIVRIGRDKSWYRDGGVADTVTGRFHMMASVTALVMLRLEREGAAAARESALLTEIFIDDMDASLRQIGIGDFVVGKQVGKLVGALGGRLGAFRATLGGEGDFDEAVRRNVFPDGGDERLAMVAGGLRALHARLAGHSLGALLAGEIE